MFNFGFGAAQAYEGDDVPYCGANPHPGWPHVVVGVGGSLVLPQVTLQGQLLTR